MKVLITLTDVEPAVRLNGMLERGGYETALVSPIDDVRAAIRRELTTRPGEGQAVVRPGTSASTAPRRRR